MPSLTNIQKMSYFHVFFWEIWSFILQLKNKIIFMGKRNIFPDNTRKFIFQCNVFWKDHLFRTFGEKKYSFLCSIRGIGSYVKGWAETCSMGYGSNVSLIYQKHLLNWFPEIKINWPKHLVRLSWATSRLDGVIKTDFLLLGGLIWTILLWQNPVLRYQ